MSEELIKWLEEKADYHDMDAELWTSGSEEAENERLEAIKYRQCARQLAEAQKVEGTSAFKRASKLTDEKMSVAHESTSPPQEGMTIKQILEALPVDEDVEREVDRLVNAQMSTECRQFPQEGMVSVPYQPKQEMADAFFAALYDEETNPDGGTFREAYHAMLKAAQGEG